jgi:hypothetical protein
MKLTEKILRRPLPDQLKALLEKFDGDFDASHLRALKNLADEPSFTRYEQFMLKRTYKDARMKLDRDSALNVAMSVVLNLKEKEDQHSGWYSDPAQQITNPYPAMPASLYQQQLDAKARAIKQDIERRMMGMPL